MGFGRAWGFGTLLVANARSWRATDPRKVPPDPEAIGPLTDGIIAELAARADLVVCGWGALGGARGPVVLATIRRAGKVPHALRLTAGGSPCHPLYLPGNLQPVPMPAGRPDSGG